MPDLSKLPQLDLFHQIEHWSRWSSWSYKIDKYPYGGSVEVWMGKLYVCASLTKAYRHVPWDHETETVEEYKERDRIAMGVHWPAKAT